MKYSKVWGTTQLLLDNPNFELHKIDIKSSGFCSVHYHKNKFNYFYVISGKLQVDIIRDNEIIDSTILIQGESTSVPPGLTHKFIALEDTMALEVYWTELIKDDITRLSQGGQL